MKKYRKLYLPSAAGCKIVSEQTVKTQMGEYLRYLVYWYSINISDFAERYHISRATFNNYICGRSLPNVLFIARLCEPLGMKHYEFYVLYERLQRERRLKRRSKRNSCSTNRSAYRQDKCL